MRGYEKLECWRCEMRSWAQSILRVPFQYCDRCKAKMRLTQGAWKTWSNGVARPSPPQ